VNNHKTLVGIIVLLIGTLYANAMWEIYKLRADLQDVRHEIAQLRAEVNTAALAAATAATAAAVAATKKP